jgi:hypothetical protein
MNIIAKLISENEMVQNCLKYAEEHNERLSEDAYEELRKLISENTDKCLVESLLRYVMWLEQDLSETRKHLEEKRHECLTYYRKAREMVEVEPTDREYVPARNGGRRAIPTHEVLEAYEKILTGTLDEKDYSLTVIRTFYEWLRHPPSVVG